MIFDLDEIDEPTGQDFYDWAQQEILDTREYIDEHYRGNWEKQLRLYLGDHWTDYLKEDQSYKSSDNPAVQLTDNQIGPYIEQLTNYVVSNVTQVRVKPTKPEEVTSSVLMQVATNYEWRKRNFHENIKECFKDSLIFGYGVGEVGYNLEVDESASPDKDGMLEYRDFMKVDAPYFRRIFPPRFMFDLSACEKNLSTARWCGEQFYQSPRYVLKNERYKSSVRSDIKNGKEKPESLHDETYAFAAKGHPNSMKGLWTMTRFYDKKFKKVYVFCKGVKKPLFEESWPWEYLDEFPIKFLPFIKHPDDWYPINFTEWIEDDQFELNRSRTAMCHWRRSNPGGQIWVHGEVGKSTREQIYRGDKLVSGFEPEQAPQTFPVGPFPQEQFIMDGIFQRQMERKSGLSDIAQGATSPGRRAATEIRTRTQFTLMRMDGYIENVDRFVLQIASDLIKHIKANYDVPRMHEIAGPLAQYWGQVVSSIADAPPAWSQQYPNGEYWVPFSKNDIQGEFDIEIETTAKSKMTPEMQLANLGQFEQMCERVTQLAASLQSDPRNIAGINYIEILRKFAELMEIKDAGRIIQQLVVIPPPIQTQTALAAQQQPTPQQGGMAPQMGMEESQMMQQAVDPASALLGSVLGGGTNNA